MTEPIAEPTELVVIAEESGLESGRVHDLLGNFAGSFQSAKNVAKESHDIVVTSEDQVTEMAKARAARLNLKSIRVDVEKTRKELKEQSLREGKAIDGMANIIKALIIPEEERLEKQEKFAEVMAQKRKNDQYIKRVELLAPYVDDISVYNLLEMDEPVFQQLLDNSMKAHAAQLEAERRAEVERKQEAERKAKEDERVRLENIKLKKEADEREKEFAKQRKLDEEKAKKEKEASDKKLAAEHKAAEIEREKREALEREKQQREQEEADRKVKEEEAQRQALLAPDKEKLSSFADTIDALVLPAVADHEAGKVLDETKDFLNRISKNLRQKAKEL